MVRAGDAVGGYTLVDRLGSGGMGTVWRAHDADGSVVALKLLHPAISADPDARSRLVREVANLHRVRGSRVARVLDAEVEDDIAFIVTELVEGLSLEESIAQEGAFDPVDLHPLAHGLHQAVTQVHAAGLLHRDLKPGNVMVTYDGPVLIDFGIAQLADDDRLTHTGFVTGTPGYLDPATLTGGNLGRAGDFYGWGAVLLFAATGRPPFGRGPMEAVLGRMTTARPDVDGLAPAVAAAFRAALAPDPAQRPEPLALLRVLENDALGIPQSVAEPTMLVPPPPGPVAGAGRAEGPDATRAVPPPPGPVWQGERTTIAPAASAAPPSAAPSSSRPAPTSRLPAVDRPTFRPGQRAAPPALQPTERGGSGHAGAPGVVSSGGHAPADVPWAAPAAAPPPSWALPPAPRRGLVVASGAFVVALAFGWPGVAAITAVVAFALLTGLGLVEGRTRQRRILHGRRPSDGWAAAGWAVPLLVLGVLRALIPLLVGAVVAASLWWLGSTVVAGDVVGRVGRDWEVLVVPVALAAGLVSAWWVPVADVTRMGARAFWNGVAPSAAARQVWVLLLVGLAVGLALAGLAGVGGPDGVWAPLPRPPKI